MTSAIIDILINDSDLVSLVGVSTGINSPKINPIFLPQGEVSPFVVVTERSVDFLNCRNEEPKFYLGNYEVLIVGNDYGLIEDISNQIIKTLATTSNYVFNLSTVIFCNIVGRSEDYNDVHEMYSKTIDVDAQINIL